MKEKERILSRSREKRRPAWRLPAFIACACLLAAALFPASCGRLEPGAEEADRTGERSGTGPENRFSFLVCGDPHGRTDLLAGIIAQAQEGEFLVILGDLTTGKGMEEMQRMKDFLDSRGLPYHVIPGDNDMPRGDRTVFRAVFGDDYYSTDLQDSHLVFLNNAVTGTGCPPEELAWLREDLAGAAGRVIIAFAHVPPGAPLDIAKTGFVEAETASNREMKDVLAAAGVPVIYCGHIHAYMIYSFGPPRVVVTGGAGADLHLSEESGGFHHFLRVTVEGDRVSEEVIPL